MKLADIKPHLRPYSIVQRRKTTINHAFAAAIAPCEPYDFERTCEAMRSLEQDPADLLCVYCRSKAETWDHVQATVSKTQFSGFGHRLGNLVPCCKTCNSRKGNQRWSDYLEKLGLSPAEAAARRRLILAYIERYGARDRVPTERTEYQQLQEIRAQVLELFARADALASQLRQEAHSADV